jgi:hypothetical protein
MAVAIIAITVVIAAAAAAMVRRHAAVWSIVLRPLRRAALARLRLNALRPVRQHVLAQFRQSLRRRPPLVRKLRLLRRRHRRLELRALVRSSASRWSALVPS